MNAESLKKELYEQAIALGVTKILLSFAGGSDEGYLDVQFEQSDDRTDDLDNLAEQVENWVWTVYDYDGTGDGNSYGDNIVYNLIEKTVTTQEWYHVEQYDDKEESSFETV